MPKKARPEMPPTLDHLVRTVSAAARHVGAFYSGKGIQDEATYGRSRRRASVCGPPVPRVGPGPAASGF